MPLRLTQRTAGRRPGAARLLAAAGAAAILWAAAARAERPRVYAIVGARVEAAPGRVFEPGTVVLRDGLIEAVGERVEVPRDAERIEGEGLWVYPAFIDPDTSIGLESAEAGGSDPDPPDRRGDGEASAGPAHPLSRVRPESRAVDGLRSFTGDRAQEASRHRELGYAAVLTAPGGGIFRGSGAVILLRDDAAVAELIVRPEATAHVAFEHGGFGQGYPTSLMGAVATIRQVLLDARRHELWARRYTRDPSGMPRPDRVSAWSALAPALAGKTPVHFRAESPEDALLAVRLADEFSLGAAISASGHEWEIADRLAESRVPLILPVAFPDGPEVDDPDRALEVTLRDLERYVEAPAAAARLHAEGVRFAFTTRGLDELGEFRRNLRRILDAGLPETAALAALTTVPAELLGIEAVAGSLEAGKIANLAIFDGPVFGQETRLRRLFVDGFDYEMEEKEPPDGGDPNAVVDPRGTWSAASHLGPPVAPEAVLVRGATIWTQGPAGRLEGADLLARDGKIVAVGRDLAAPRGAKVVEAAGMHLTPGLIDCHSHTAIRGGVNEGSDNVTAEVRIRDVIDPGDVDIYRQLAGGLTAAHLLHGSANSIGGQDAVIKLRRGATRRGMLLEGAPPGIKFALGENPKRSNFRSLPIPDRYPKTRMGVIQSIREAFLAARDYEREWQEYEALSGAERERRPPPRKDLRAAAVLEVLRGERRVHSHSYRQDEILALIRLAEEFGVEIATFQHVLEGYKVADEIAAHGAGASTFSDWWAYKLEAYDATPFNGALMHERGVEVSFNSDSSELARRMNLEAAKAVKYGGLDAERALDFVTRNAASQLGVDHRIGSLEAGKDADFVLWSGDPLSVYSIVLQTWVDGARHFDRDEDLAAREVVERRRAELVERIEADEQDEKPEEEAAEGKAPESEEPESEVAETEEADQAEPGQAEPAEETPSVPPLDYRDRLAASGPTISIVNATVHTVSGETIEGGTVSFAAGRILEVGAGLTPPPGAQVVDAAGRHLYPGLIEANSALGLTEIGSVAGSVDSEESGDLNPEVNTAIAVNPDSELLPVTRANGLTHVLTVPGGALVRGTSALIRLDGWTWEDLAASTPVAMHLGWPAFRPERRSFLRPAPTQEEQDKEREEAMKTLRRLFSDARAYARARAAARAGGAAVRADPKLEAMLPVLERRLPVIVHAEEIRQIKSALEWAEEEGVRMILAGSQDVWRVADRLREARVPVILTDVLDLPARDDEPYDTPYTTAAKLHAAGVEFCIAGSGVRFGAANTRNLPYHAAMASAFGLPREEAIRALTLYPARILGLGDHLGSIEPGKSASLILTDGDPLEIRTRVEAAFIDGRPVDLEANRHHRLYRRYASRPEPPQGAPQ